MGKKKKKQIWEIKNTRIPQEILDLQMQIYMQLAGATSIDSVPPGHYKIKEQPEVKGKRCNVTKPHDWHVWREVTVDPEKPFRGLAHQYRCMGHKNHAPPMLWMDWMAKGREWVQRKPDITEPEIKWYARGYAAAKNEEWRLANGFPARIPSATDRT